MATVQKGEELFKDDSKSTFLFLVESGSFRITKQDEKSFEVGRGRLVGFLSIIYSFPRKHSAKALSDSQIWCFEKTLFSAELTKIR